MKIIKKLSLIIKERKGITGADIAAAMSVIVLTVGVVTAIYINAINKSKDNMRYANAVRIATNIIENIQNKPYEFLVEKCKTSDTCTVKGTSSAKIFDTKIPNGFTAEIIAKKPTTSDDIIDADVARDVTVKVKYRASNTYKTITINTVKEKELMDMTNSPDFSLLPEYNPSSNSKFYYPVTGTTGSYKITTTSDINWYDYEEGNYAIVCESTNGEQEIGGDVESTSALYVWIPRFVVKNSTNETNTENDINNVQFLYGSSDYAITLNKYGNLFAYGLKYEGTINDDSKPKSYDNSSFTSDKCFSSSDKVSGVWYKINATNGENSADVKNKATTLNSKIKCQNATINNT